MSLCWCCKWVSMPCCQQPDHILDICYHHSLKASPPPLLVQVLHGPSLIASLLYCAIFTQSSGRTMRGRRGSGAFLSAFTSGGMWNMSSMHSGITLWGFIVILRGCEGCSIEECGGATRRLVKCLICSAALLTYISRPEWEPDAVLWTKFSRGSFDRTLKKETPGKKRVFAQIFTSIVQSMKREVFL